ncbi:MAG: acyltransferase [Spirochaetales bacterium]|nr:acyltransferase [Spirochaetales bacterium]
MTNRYPYIDVLRGIAILLVLAHHVIFLPGYRHDPSSLQYITYLIGWAGVDLFFVISGFLIGGLVFREIRDTGEFRIGRFYYRRALRILPVYYFLLAIVFLLISSASWTWSTLLGHLFFLQNYTGFLSPASGAMLIHTWSLCIEEHFYLIFPFLIFLLQKTNHTPIFPWLAISLLPICLVLRLSGSSGDSDQDIMNLLYKSHFRADALALGTIIAYFHTYRGEHMDRVLARKWWLIGLSVVCFMPLTSIPIHGPASMKTWGLTTNLLGAAALLLLALRTKTTQLKWLSPWAFMGTLTYTLYMVHPLVVSPVVLGAVPELKDAIAGVSEWIHTSSLPLAGFFYVAVYVAISLPVAWLVAVLVETPGLWLRKRWVE